MQSFSCTPLRGHTHMHTHDMHTYMYTLGTPIYIHPHPHKRGRLLKLSSANIVDSDYNTILGHNTLRSINRIKLLKTVRDDHKRRKIAILPKYGLL